MNSVLTPEAEPAAQEVCYWKGFCEHCGGHLEFPARAAGTRIDCPHCRQRTRLLRSAMHDSRPAIKGACANCGGHLEYTSAEVGATIPCPHCGEPTVLAPPRPADAPLKCSCANCAGHIAFPAALAGTSIPCPHCGLKTLLPAHLNEPPANQPLPATVAPPRRKTQNLVIGLTVAALLLGAGIGPYAIRLRKAAPPRPAKELEVLNYRLEKDKASGLLYLTGTLTNHTDTIQRSVRIELDLLAADGRRLANLFDFKPDLPPHGIWEIKTLVLENEATQARLLTVSSDKR
ncbi:MAG: FxLYD domain-containing protein [Verrucomicrobiota bacterium]